VRVTFGFIWLVDAAFKWDPNFHSHYLELIAHAAENQPGWMAPWFGFWQALFSIQPTLFAYTTAALETVLAVAIIFGLAPRITYSVGVLWSLLIWTTAEGFGRADGPAATDIGTAIIYAVVFLALLVLEGRNDQFGWYEAIRVKVPRRSRAG
jgi:nitrite reductase (NO-forming)